VVSTLGSNVVGAATRNFWCFCDARIFLTFLGIGAIRIDTAFCVIVVYVTGLIFTIVKVDSIISGCIAFIGTKGISIVRSISCLLDTIGGIIFEAKGVSVPTIM
jgi:hypothetical protein